MAKSRFLDGYKTYDPKVEGFGNAEQWNEKLYERMTSGQAKKIINETKSQPHIILGIPKNATGREIKTAFRQLIMKWHPDKNPDNLKEAEEMTKKIIAAYTVITEG